MAPVTTVRCGLWRGVLLVSAVLAGGCKDSPPANGGPAPSPGTPSGNQPAPKPGTTPAPASTTPATPAPAPAGAATPAPKPAGGPARSPAGNLLTDVKIAGKTFRLEVADTDPVRYKGLGGRTEIAEDGGMIFAFPPQMVMVFDFVMRDCPIDIDILYTDGRGKVLAEHTMKSEPPRDPSKGEGNPGDVNVRKYEERLPKYSSYYPATFAIELRAGTIKKLGVKTGDIVEFDHQGLKSRAR